MSMSKNHVGRSGNKCNMKSRLNAWIRRPYRDFPRISWAGVAILSMICACDSYKAPRKTEVYNSDLDSETLPRWNLREDKHDGFSLRTWTDAGRFFTTGVVNMFCELQCPTGFTPGRIRVLVDSPGVSNLCSSCARDFTGLQPLSEQRNLFRFEVSDCFKTSTKLDVSNGLKVGKHTVTCKVVIDDGPTFNVKFDIEVRYQTGG